MSKIQLRKIREAGDALQAASESIVALDAARQLRESADALELEMVRAAREDGHSWSRIGAVYGLTKQGAQQRFRANPPELGEEVPARASRSRRKAKNEMDPAAGSPAK